MVFGHRYATSLTLSARSFIWVAVKLMGCIRFYLIKLGLGSSNKRTVLFTLYSWVVFAIYIFLCIVRFVCLYIVTVLHSRDFFISGSQSPKFFLANVWGKMHC